MGNDKIAPVGLAHLIEPRLFSHSGGVRRHEMIDDELLHVRLGGNPAYVIGERVTRFEMRHEGRGIRITPHQFL